MPTTKYNVCRSLTVAMILALVTGCAGTQMPDLYHPGSAGVQRRNALVHDPYPLNDIAPAVAGGRPPEYIPSIPEPVRAQMSPSAQVPANLRPGGSPWTATVAPGAPPALPPVFTTTPPPGAPPVGTAPLVTGPTPPAPTFSAPVTAPPITAPPITAPTFAPAAPPASFPTYQVRPPY